MRTRLFAIIGIALPMMAVGMNFSIVNMAIATLQNEFSSSVSQMQWILNALGISCAALLVMMGKWADTYGRRRMYLIGTIFVFIASLLSGFAPKVGWIITAQAIQGIGAAIVLPTSQALLTHLYPESERSRAMGIWAMLACTSLAIGPIVGGTILSTISWRWIFLINAPMALFSIYPLLRFVSESKTKEKEFEFDFKGVVLLIVTISSLVFTIMQAPSWGWGVWKIALLFFIALALFIYSERKSKTPIIRPDFFF
ncbi:MAG: MFS transporter [Parachlamydiales bacterium]|nr:MFS transporter [Parachlamydiales bacterium]